MDKIKFAKLILLFPLLLILLSSSVFAAPHEGWNELWKEMMIDIVLIGVVFLAVTIYLLIKYKRKNPDEKGYAPKLKPIAALGWVLIPAFIFVADDIFLGLKNWDQWRVFRNVPENAYAVDVTSYMWGYEINYPEGITTQNELRVPVGKPIHVRLGSRDVIHTFFIPDFRVKWDALPGRIHYLWFYPDKTGEHVVTCTEFCGILHSGMYGKVIVMNEGDFAKWIEENKVKEENKPAEEDKSKEGGKI